MFTYDLMDGLTRVDYPDGNYVAYSYDNACRLTKVATPFGDTSYEYDLLDRLTRVVDRNGYATIYEYDANGNRTAVHYANGFTTTYDYDLLNRLIRQETVDIDGDIVVQYIYTLGAAGERKSVTELDRTVEYSYDSLYRLTSETIIEGEKVTAYTYVYDNVSNRILKTENGAETAYVYNALNQLVSDSNTSYEYDLNGNLVRVIGSAQSAIYEYNAENKLVKATVQNGSLVIEESYTYDYQGNRTSKTTHKSNGEFEYTKYLNDNSSLTNVLAEIDENGTAKCVYTIGADLVSQERDGKVSVYLYDGHGSVVGLANENGKVTDTYAYDAFGNLLDSTGSTKNCYRYCGEQFDETTGLYYLRARYMDTSTGRFISQDSYAGSISDPTSLHKYLYANANPVTYSDPSGYSAIVDFGVTLAINAVLGGIISGAAYSLAFVDDLIKGLNSGEIGEFSFSEYIKDLAGVFVDGFIKGFQFAYVFTLTAMLFCLIPGVSAELMGAFLGAFFAGYSFGNAIIQIMNGNYLSAVFDFVMCGVCIYGTSKSYSEYDAKFAQQAQTNLSASARNSSNPRDYLNDALKQQNLKNTPSQFKQKWSENGYDYEVRVHPAESQYGKSGSIYRVARRRQGVDLNGQGYGWEYLGNDGVWYHTSVLKPQNPNYNPKAAEDTHIQL